LYVLNARLAEVMLQQTQLAVVLPFWRSWMAAFPTLAALAAADEHDVLMLWQGLGYYARARRLQQGARQLLAAGRDGDQATAVSAASVIKSRTSAMRPCSSHGRNVERISSAAAAESAATASQKLKANRQGGVPLRGVNSETRLP